VSIYLFTLKQNSRFKAYKNIVLRNVLGPDRYKVTAAWKRIS